MKCVQCFSTQDLHCQTCNDLRETEVAGLHEKATLVLKAKRKQVEQKQKKINVSNFMAINELEIKRAKIQKAKLKIQQLKELIQQEKQKNRTLKEIDKFYEQNLKITSSQVQGLYLQDLLKRNKALQSSIKLQKKQKKNMIDKLLKVYSIEQKKYKIQKYLRVEQNRNSVMFTLQGNNLGIPVIKANNQQVIVYHPLQQNDEVIRREEEQMLINTLKVSSKFLGLVLRIFVSRVKLPYKMYLSRQFLYLGNSLVSFDSNLELGSANLLNVLNMLQGNIEYMAFAIGTKQKPFLILDKAFYEDLEKREFEIGNFRRGERKWKSFLRCLKPQQIQQHYEQQNQTELIVLADEKKSQASDDEYFQILE